MENGLRTRTRHFNGLKKCAHSSPFSCHFCTFVLGDSVLGPHENPIRPNISGCLGGSWRTTKVLALSTWGLQTKLELNVLICIEMFAKQIWSSFDTSKGIDTNTVLSSRQGSSSNVDSAYFQYLYINLNVRASNCLLWGVQCFLVYGIKGWGCQAHHALQKGTIWEKAVWALGYLEYLPVIKRGTILELSS